MWTVSVALLVVFLVLWLSWRWKLTSTFSTLGIPGPKPSILFGNLVELYQKGPIKCHEEWIEKYGRVVGYYYGMQPMLIVADPKLLKTIFIKDFSKFVDRVPVHPLFPRKNTDENFQGVINLTGRRWKEVRSVLTPNFSTAKMKKMSNAMNSSIEVMLDIMRKKAGTREIFNIHDNFQRLTMDIISRTALGVLIDVQTNPGSRALETTKLIFSNRYSDLLTFTLLCLPSLHWFGRKLEFFMQAIRNKGVDPRTAMRKGIARVIDFRRKNPESRKPDLLQMLLETKINPDENAEINLNKLEAGEEGDLLETESKEEKQKKMRNLSDKEVIANAIVVFVAGYETTSTALGFASHLLGRHPDVQDRVFEEVNELIKRGEKLEYASVNKLPYLDKVLNESMRMYPPVYLFVNRFANEDIDYGGLKIPEGMRVQAPVYFLHHDAEYWTDPETFDPGRFNSKPNVDGITYLPFGIGPRNCMGMRFAQMEAKLVLAHLILNFHIEVAPCQKENLPVTMRVQTLTPTNGIKVILKTRDQETAL